MLLLSSLYHIAGVDYRAQCLLLLLAASDQNFHLTPHHPGVAWVKLSYFLPSNKHHHPSAGVQSPYVCQLPEIRAGRDNQLMTMRTTLATR